MWRLRGNPHGGDCLFYSTAQLIGWEGNEDQMLRLRRECAAVVRAKDTDVIREWAESRFDALWITNRKIIRWYGPFAEKPKTNELIIAMREGLAQSMEERGYWGDELAASFISDLYDILFFVVVENGDMYSVASRVGDRVQQNGPTPDTKFGILCNVGEETFDAICYKPDADTPCISAINRQSGQQYPEIHAVINGALAVLVNGGRMVFPVSVIELEKEVDEEKEEEEDISYGVPRLDARQYPWRVRVGIFGDTFRSEQRADGRFEWRRYTLQGPVSFHPNAQRSNEAVTTGNALVTAPFRITKKAPRAPRAPKPEVQRTPIPIQYNLPFITEAFTDGEQLGLDDKRRISKANSGYAEFSVEDSARRSFIIVFSKFFENPAVLQVRTLEWANNGYEIAGLYRRIVNDINQVGVIIVVKDRK